MATTNLVHNTRINTVHEIIDEELLKPLQIMIDTSLSTSLSKLEAKINVSNENTSTLKAQFTKILESNK
jgi:hypothetical protein